ncbi:MAG: YkgJ family cysteine cluster protein [Sphingomicrobium sp.]
MTQERQPGEAFSYACRLCGRCCSNKRIQINPYETARLAQRLGETAATFRSRWTVEGKGVELSQTPDGACVFLGPEGCTVHADRPLVCRLYPLGRHVSPEGRVWYTDVDLHPPPGGLFGVAGTIESYLESQGAGPFIVAADAYFFWFGAAMRRLEAAASREEAGSDETLVEDLLDLETVVAQHCKLKGVAEPEDIEARRELHLEILYARLNELEEIDGEP